MTATLAGALFAAVCAVSPIENRLATVVGTMAGTEPAWIVSNGTAVQWQGPNQVTKTLWIFSRQAAGSLRVTGKQLDGDGTLRFQDGGIEGHPADALEIADPWKRSVIPGGASAEILRAYSFIPNYVIYPSPGCWEFTVQLGATSTRIVLATK
jgi:hypothetical protein